MAIKENDVASYNGYSNRVNFIKEELSKGTTPINIVTAFNKKFTTVNIVVTDDTKKKLRNNQTLINKCYVNEMYKKLDYWQGLVDDYATRVASKVQDSMQKADATKYSIEKYKNYLTNLEYVRRMTSDRRTIKEMMQVINNKSNNPDRDFYNYVETRNNWVEVYQKKFATELKAKSISNYHIAKILNRSESYVRLLLDNTNQDKLAKGASKTPNSNASKAKELAEKNTSVADIGKQLNITKDVAKTVHNLLGDSYMKAWAKRLADADNSVSAISDKLGKEDSWVRDTALKTSYLTSWAKKLAYNNTSVTDILTQFGIENTANNRTNIRTTYLGDTFCISWVLRRLRSGKKMSEIATMLGYDPEYKNKKITKTAAQVLKADKSSMPSESKIKDIARNIADGNRTKVDAIKIIQARLDAYELADIVKLLGPSYIMSWVQALDNEKNYKGAYYKKYNDIQNIVDPVSLNTVKEYAEMANKPASWKSARLNSISSSLSTLPVSSSNIEKKRKKVRDLVKNVDTTMTTIRNDDDMKKYYGKTPSVEDIRTLMGGQTGAFFKNWAKRLASNGSAVGQIVVALGYGTNIKDKAKTDAYDEVKNTLLGKKYMREWAKDLFNNESDIASIATKLSISNKDAYDYVGEGAIKEKVKGMIRGENPNTIPKISSFLGGTGVVSYAYIRDTLLGTEEIRLYLNRVISSNGIEKTADDIKREIFGISKDDKNYKDYMFKKLFPWDKDKKEYKPGNALKTWVLNLRANGKNVTAIVSHIKETQFTKDNLITSDYVRDKLLGNKILKPWILEIIKDITKTADDVKTATGVPAITIPVIIGDDAFRSWAIRLTKYYDKNDKSKPKSPYSAQDILRKLGTIKSASDKGYVEIKSDLNDSTINKKDWIKGLHSLLEKEYRIQWVLRLKNKAGLDQSQIVIKTGIDEATVKKYMAAKDLS